MEIRKYGNRKILIADNNKQIRDKNDVEHIDEETHELVKPYYTSIIFLADNFDEDMLNDIYVEENIEEE